MSVQRFVYMEKFTFDIDNLRKSHKMRRHIGM